ncbi:hypothetical protein [Haladaptatus sp. DYSN1]|uniref:hypothetical protein n=1 Tax=unclassified Haladaptatus TaxID=2622732 RepID=UPI002405A78E|nr:hypothetical protein [Haladaptatus sp. DYSN1]
MAWVRTLVLVGLLLALAPMAGVAVDPATSPSLTATSSRTPDGIRYDITVEPASVEGLWVDPGDEFDVVGVSGLEETTRGERRVYRWDGESSVATLSLEYEISNSNGVTAGPEFTRADDWVLGPVPDLELSWDEDGQLTTRRPFSDPTDPGVTITTDGPGVVGERYAFLGAHDRYEQRGSETTVQLVVPRGVELDQAPDTILDALLASESMLDVGSPSEEVLIFALPDPARGGGESFLGANELWVHAESRLDTPNNVWLHEYIHTRQSFMLASEMVWLREASAEYYGAKLAHEHGFVSETTVHEYVRRPGHEDTVLADTETWTEPGVPYTKGTRTLAKLDERIRAATDGERSLDDVMRRLNEHDGVVTYAVFERTVAAVAGQSMDEWLWEQVHGSENPRPLTTPWVVHQAKALTGPLTPLPTDFGSKSPAAGLGGVLAVGSGLALLSRK